MFLRAPICIGAIAPRVGEPVVYARTASTSTDTVSHLGHSLVSDYISHGEWPGHLKRILLSLGQTNAETLQKDNTTPGSGIQAQWELGDTRYGADSPVSNIAQFDALVITEAGPPPHITQSGAANSLMTDTLDYLMRFGCNLVENGAGTDLILWPCWPDNRGPGRPAVVPPWDTYDFRDGLDAYEDTFKFMADYVTYKVNALYPDLGGTWRCWIAPSHRFWMRVYDDIQDGLVPGVTTLQEMFSRDWNEGHTEVVDDTIHASPLTGYGLACLVTTMMFQVDLRSQSGVWVPAAYTAANDIEWPALPQARAEYFWQIAWEIARDYEPAGMGGTSGAAARWTLAEDGDPMPLWTFADPTRETEPEEPGEGELPDDIIAQISPSAVTGLTFSPALPAATGGYRAISGNDPQSPISGGVYMAVRGRRASGGPIFASLGTHHENWNADLLNIAAHEGRDRWVASRMGENEFALDYNEVPLDTVPHTLEGWYEGGSVYLSLDGGTPVSVVTPTYTAFTTLYLGLYGGVYDLAGLIVTASVPTEGERAGIRAALAAA